MGAIDLREEMITYINQADARLLKVLKAVVEDYLEQDIVAYDVNGKSLNLQEYNNQLQAAEDDIAAGNYSKQEDLEKEAEGW